MAGQGGGFPYIGSTISLISKSDMKYVGKLVQVDSVNSTVTLQNGTKLLVLVYQRHSDP
jgi:hypothetical protein